MEYIITLVFIILSFVAIYKIKMFRVKGIANHWFAGAFAFKLILALGMVFMYSRTSEIKSSADIFKYYEDGKAIYQTLKTDPQAYFKIMSGIDTTSPEVWKYIVKTYNWDNHKDSSLFSNNRLIIRYIAFLSIFTLGHYGGILVITLFLSFMGLFWIFRFFNSKLPNKKWLIFALIFFTPSIAFWSSGLLKETLIIFAIGLLLNCGNYALKGKKPIPRFVMVLLAFAIIFQLKAFVFFTLFPAVIGYLWNHYRPKQRVIIPYFILWFLAFSFASESNKYMNTGLFDLLLEKQLAFTELAIQENAQSMIPPIQFDANSLSVMLNAPIAIINTLFRPMFWEVKNSMMAAAALENTILLLSLILIIIFPAKEIENRNLLWLCLSFALAFFVINGLMTPVLGALSRYRIPALLFFEMGLIQLIDFELVKQKILSFKR